MDQLASDGVVGVARCRREPTARLVERERQDVRRPEPTHALLAPGQPSLWCGWEPCWDGCCLSHDGVEKFYGATRWLTYLIDHFLAPKAHAANAGQACFDDLTFDHRLDGIIAACRRDTRELYLIQVEDNVVREKTLHAPEARFIDADLLPYERAIDDSRVRRRRPRRA